MPILAHMCQSTWWLKHPCHAGYLAQFVPCRLTEIVCTLVVYFAFGTCECYKHTCNLIKENSVNLYYTFHFRSRRIVIKITIS